MRLGLGEGRPSDGRLGGFMPQADRPSGFTACLRVLGKDLGSDRSVGHQKRRINSAVASVMTF